MELSHCELSRDSRLHRLAPIQGREGSYFDFALILIIFNIDHVIGLFLFLAVENHHDPGPCDRQRVHSSSNKYKYKKHPVRRYEKEREKKERNKEKSL